MRQEEWFESLTPDPRKEEAKLIVHTYLSVGEILKCLPERREELIEMALLEAKKATGIDLSYMYRKTKADDSSLVDSSIKLR